MVVSQPGFGKNPPSPSGKKTGIKAQENRSGNKEKKFLLNVGEKNPNLALQSGEKPGREDGNGQGEGVGGKLGWGSGNFLIQENS